MRLYTKRKKMDECKQYNMVKTISGDCFSKMITILYFCSNPKNHKTPSHFGIMKQI